MVHTLAGVASAAGSWFIQTAQNHASPERCHKSFTIIFRSDHDFPLTGSNFGNLTAFRAIFSHIFTAHAQERPFMNFHLKKKF